MFSNLIKKMFAAFFNARKCQKRISVKTGKNIVMDDDENIVFQNFSTHPGYSPDFGFNSRQILDITYQLRIVKHLI